MEGVFLQLILESSLGGGGPVRSLRGGGKGRWQDHPTVFISLVLGPQNSLVCYVPSLWYTHGLAWRMHCGVEITETSTKKQHLLSGEEVFGPKPITLK